MIYCKGYIFISLLLTGCAFLEAKKPVKLPDGIELCRKDDPQLNMCLQKLFEKLRPNMATGIPEVGLPPMDPLILKEVVIFRGGKGQMRAIGRDVKITGISNYKIIYFKADVDKLEIEISLSFPWLQYEGAYDVNMNFMNLPIKGKGPMFGNTSEVISTAKLKGMFVEKEGDKYVEFTSADVDVIVKDYYIRVDKLFPDKQLNDALNIMMNDRKFQSIQTAKPIVNKLAGRMLLEVVNNIAQHLSFEEVFAGPS